MKGNNYNLTVIIVMIIILMVFMLAVLLTSDPVSGDPGAQTIPTSQDYCKYAYCPEPVSPTLNAYPAPVSRDAEPQWRKDVVFGKPKPVRAK